MPQGDKSSYTAKQKRKAAHIEEGYRKRGVSAGKAEERAWRTVNKQDGGAKGKKSSSSKSKSGSKSSSRSRKSSSRKSSGSSKRSGGRSSSRSSRSRPGSRKTSSSRR